MIRILTAEKVVVTRSFDKLTISTVCVNIDGSWSIILGLKWLDCTEQSYRCGLDTVYDCPWSIEWKRRFNDAASPLCDWYVEHYCAFKKKVLSKDERNEHWFEMYCALGDAMPRESFLAKNFKKQGAATK